MLRQHRSDDRGMMTVLFASYASYLADLKLCRACMCRQPQADSPTRVTCTLHILADASSADSLSTGFNWIKVLIRRDVDWSNCEENTVSARVAAFVTFFVS